MRKFGKESTAPAEKGADRDSGNGWLSGHRCALILGVIVIVAFLLRFVFAYGVSADGSFALSGGAGAQYHLHVIESILDGTWSMTDSSVNYPVGGLLVIPPLMDFIAAGVASILGGTTESASLALGVLAPVFGALACIPVFLIGKELYDKTIGVVAALIYAFLALPISTSVFSNGNEYALAAFLVAFAVLFAVKMVKAADSEDSAKGAILKNALIAGLFLALAALTWNGFRSILVLFAIMMVVQIVVSRIRGKDFSGILSGYALILLVGTLVPAAYYIPADLMDAVYSGCLLVAVVSVVFAYIFLALRSKPWIVTIPALVIAFVAFCAVLSIAAPELYTDFVFGNSVYQSSIMEELSSDRVSMSNVAAYYGWLTMWLPICLGFYEAYRLVRKDRSSSRLFTVLWLFGMAFIAWSSYANAAVVGCVFAVGSSAAIVGTIRRADIRSYASSVKAAGFPGCFRKLIKPFPLATVLVVALLVVLPNASFAVDAGMPSNTEDENAYFYGNTSFTIKTGDSYPMGNVWSEFDGADKDGALATWMDYAYDSVTQGGFSSVTDSNGNGASAVAQMYLADGTGAAVSAMIIRIMMSNSDVDFKDCFADSEVFSKISGFIENPSAAVEEIKENPDVYGKLRADMTDENAVYLASVEAMTSAMNDSEIMGAYDKICDRSGQKIGYILVDGSMLPLQYNDGDSFSTIAYFANYSVDRYGAASQFYSYNTYYGTTVYTDAIYETLLWKAMIGPSYSDRGYSSSYAQLSALALSDGSDDNAKAIPGYGLAGFEVASWQVMYNPDKEATLSSDGWEYMDGWEAMEKQKTDGGLINYLSSIVMLAYTGTTSDVVSGTVVDSAGEPVKNAVAEVYTYSDVYKTYVLSSKAATKADGSFDVLASGDYRVEIRLGSVVLGTMLPSDFASSAKMTVGTADLEGEVVVGDAVYGQEAMGFEMKNGTASYTADVADGKIVIRDALPGTYDYTLNGADGSSLATGTVTVYPGENVGFAVSPKTYTITATVEDVYGDAVDGTKRDVAPIVIATNQTTGAQFTAEVGEDGKAVVTVIPGKYNVAVGNGMVSSYTTTQNASSGNRSVSIPAYEARTIDFDRQYGDVIFAVSGGSFSTMSYRTASGATVVDVPVSNATEKMAYSVYALVGDKVYYGLIDETSTTVSISAADAVLAEGKLQSGTTGKSGTVTFMLNGSYFQISTGADSDGKYSVYVPAGTYTVYANNGSDKVSFVNSVSVSGEKTALDVSLVDGRKVTAGLKFDQATSDSNMGLAFVLAQMSFTHDGVDYVLTSMTGTGGTYVFYIPDSIEAETSFNGGAFKNTALFDAKYLTKKVSSGTATTSSTIIIEYLDKVSDYSDTEKTKDKNFAALMDYVAPCDMKLEYYEDVEDKTIELEKGASTKLRPGQYDVTVDGSTGYYFDGTAYLYPGSVDSDGKAVFVGLDLIEVGKVDVKRDITDVVKIESVSYDEDSTDEGSHYRFDGGYYLEVGYKYYFTSTNGDKIAYGYVEMENASSVSIDITASSEKMKVTGVVGIDANGDITVRNGTVAHVFDVENGAYTLTLPSSWTSVTATVDVTSGDGEFESTATAEFTGMKDGSVRNISVLSADAPVDDDEKDFTVSLDSIVADNGRLTAAISVTNNTDSAKTYLVKAGSDLTLDAAFSVNVPAKRIASVTVTGKYDAARVAPGSAGMTLEVSDINASSTETVELLPSATGGTVADGMTVSKAGEDGASNDKVSASQYMYALTFVNKDVFAKDVTISASVGAGWSIVILNEDGTCATAVGGTVKVYGLQTTTYYLACMLLSSEKGDSSEVPAVSASVSFDGSSKTLDLKPISADVDAGKTTVSGGDAVMERSSVPGGIWFLLAVSILLVIAIFWLASKRGVFSRR